MFSRLVLIGGGILAAVIGLKVLAHPPDSHGQGAHKESAEGKTVTVTGELIDTACYVTSDGDAKGQDHAQCAKECMGSGVPAGILPEGAKDASEMVFLLTNPAVLAPYAAQTVRAEGKTYANLHAMDVQKLYVKDGNNWKEIKLNDAHHDMAGGSGSDHGADHSTQPGHKGHK